MRRTILIALTALVALVAIVGLASTVTAGGNTSSVTRARLEKSFPVVFANTYVNQAHILGRNVTAASLHAKAMCDKHGPDVADIGPGGDWNCLMSWTDPQVPMPPEGYGKFELNVHSNDCFTASGPSKLTGFLAITDKHGKDVTNPLFEFDGCLDPHGDNTATGVHFPSLFAVTSPNLTPNSHGRTSVSVTCGTGAQGCAGTVVATAGKVNLGTMPFKLREEATGTLRLPKPLPAGTKEVTLTVEPSTGVGPPGPATIPVQGS
jgi:hypothetical protein